LADPAFELRRNGTCRAGEASLAAGTAGTAGTGARGFDGP